MQKCYGISPIWRKSAVFSKKSTGFAGRVLSLRSRFDALAYAFSLNDLYATTLDALTSFPRKARREPTFVLVLVAS